MAVQPAIPGLILAGGGARRMGGGDKALLPLAGRPLVAHVVDRLAPQVGRLALGANGDPARFSGFGLAVVADGEPGMGPLAGLLAGLDWAAALGAPALVTAAVDTPFLPRDLVARLLAAAGAAGIAVAAAEGGAGPERHPTAGLWPVALRAALRADLAAGERRLGAWAAARGCAVARFPDAGAFFNVNTPADLARAEAMLAACRLAKRGGRE
jgi:molybdopterin-guanine dinucleotide biosynthesis protein A